jgi:hypothetical protein
MAEDYVQQRIKEIYDAYERNGRTRDYKITLTPINGSGDIHVALERGQYYPDYAKNTKVTKKRIIKKGDSLEFIQQEN